MEGLREQRQFSRTARVGAAVAVVYVAFAVFAQLIGEDQADETATAQLNGFCTALYADYPGLIQALAYQDGSFGPLIDSEGGRQLYGGFFDTVDLAPEEFRDDVTYLADGIQRAADGELAPSEVEAYISRYEDLRQAATPACNAVGREVQGQEIEVEGQDFRPSDPG